MNIDNLQRLWSPPPPPFRYVLAKDLTAFSKDDEVSRVLDLLGSGVTYYDLVRILTKCDDCRMIMTPHAIPDHDCTITLTRSGRQKKKVWNLHNARLLAKVHIAAETLGRGNSKGKGKESVKRISTGNVKATSPAITISSNSD